MHELVIPQARGREQQRDMKSHNRKRGAGRASPSLAYIDPRN